MSKQVNITYEDCNVVLKDETSKTTEIHYYVNNEMYPTKFYHNMTDRLEEVLKDADEIYFDSQIMGMFYDTLIKFKIWNEKNFAESIKLIPDIIRLTKHVQKGIHQYCYTDGGIVDMIRHFLENNVKITDEQISFCLLHTNSDIDLIKLFQEYNIVFSKEHIEITIECKVVVPHVNQYGYNMNDPIFVRAYKMCNFFPEEYNINIEENKRVTDIFLRSFGIMFEKANSLLDYVI